MINGKTYYQILGVLDYAEDIVIRAAYKSLSSKYHPDRWQSDKSYATERMSEINRAYETLSDTEKRRKYDSEIKQAGLNNAFQESTETASFDEFFEESESDWKYATEFFPDADTYFKTLRKFDAYLALAYRQKLLESRKFNDAKEIYLGVKEYYLEKFFGLEPLTKRIAENLVLKGRRDVALEINKAVRIMGTSVSAPVMLKKILDKADLSEKSVNLLSKVALTKSLEDFANAFHYLNFRFSHGLSIKDELTYEIKHVTNPSDRVVVKSITELENLLKKKVNEWLTSA